MLPQLLGAPVSPKKYVLVKQNNLGTHLTNLSVTLWFVPFQCKVSGKNLRMNPEVTKLSNGVFDMQPSLLCCRALRNRRNKEKSDLRTNEGFCTGSISKPLL